MKWLICNKLDFFRIKYSIVIFFIAFNCTYSQAPVEVKDIRPGKGSAINCYENCSVVYKGKLLFTANDGVHGAELWISNGSSIGTYMVLDINPGGKGSNGSNYILVNDKVVFTADSDGHGFELWVTDGTSIGTHLLKDINPGIGNGITDFVALDEVFFVWKDILYFRADDGEHGIELWRTDGTSSGTYLLKDLKNDSGNETSSNPIYFAGMQDKFVFTVFFGGANGFHLVVSDGTSVGTKILHITELFYAEDLYEYNGMVIFSGDQFETGIEPWITDGTDAGTRMIKDINLIPETGSLSYFKYRPDDRFFLYNGLIYFGADDGINGIELWRTDGTMQNTQLVSDAGNGVTPKGQGPANFSLFRDELLYTHNDGIHGRELWLTDGTETGTFLVKDLRVGIESSIGPHPDIIVYDNNIYFGANLDSVWSEKLYISDGSEIGTLLVSDVYPGVEVGANPDNFSILDNNLLFSARTENGGEELWGIVGDTILQDEINLNDIQVRPNFGSGQFYLYYPFYYDALTLRMYNIQGGLVYGDDNVTYLEHIQIGDLAAGLYIIEIITGREKYILKYLCTGKY